MPGIVHALNNSFNPRTSLLAGGIIPTFTSRETET